ncbi:MAG: pyrroline-5-carboxylate reductase [Oscillospiraceae bacterium]|nr:pyrroline-5-carboxylate reductase [Oscillospiraceae bacterium]
MNNKIGFIGVGNMGGALARAVAAAVGGERLVISDMDTEKTAKMSEELGCSIATAAEVTKTCRYIFLGLKPQVMPLVLEELKPVLAAREDRFVLVTMAAGMAIARISELAGDKYPTIRIMPNMPAAVGAGMILFSCCPIITKEEKAEFLEMMSHSGELQELSEGLIDAGCALSGCGPAFAFMFIEALADGGVRCGLPRPAAMKLAAQTLFGSAKMVMEDGRHPGELKDAVCSPGGTTIEGVAALEKAGFRGAAMNAVIAAYEKTVNIGK